MAKATETHIFVQFFLLHFFQTFYFGKNEKFRHSFDIEKNTKTIKKIAYVYT